MEGNTDIDKKARDILIQILHEEDSPYTTSPSEKDVQLVKKIYGIILFVNEYTLCSIVINRGCPAGCSGGLSTPLMSGTKVNSVDE